MSLKNISSKVEKELVKTTEGFENLFQAMSEYVDSAISTLADTVKKCNGMLENQTSKLSGKPVKRVAKKKTVRKAKEGSESTDVVDDPNKLFLKESLINILKESVEPLTEETIAKKLLENQDKYRWNKNESTLYQTLRRAVKEKLITESDVRSKDAKTYQVA